jgi:phosphohistidine phosphatase
VNTDSPRRLVLVRHAKSDWPEHVADHDRPLAARGRRDAPLVGRWLARSGYVPDTVICSTARRAQETWDLASAALAAVLNSAALNSAVPQSAAPQSAAPSVPPVRLEPRVYEATVLGLLMLVRELHSELRTVAIVGHNPGLAELAVGLAAPPPQPPASFPTAAVAVLAISGDWFSAGPSEATLLAFAVPADMRGA